MVAVYSLKRLAERVLRRINSICRSAWYGFEGKKITIGWGVDIRYPEYVSVGDRTDISDGCELFAYPAIDGVRPRIVIGKNVLLNRGTIIGCANRVVIEDNVLIAPHVHISDRDHIYEDIDEPVVAQGTRSKGPVVIGEGSWIGFGCQIMSGVKIGKHCVVAAGSIVTKSVDDYTVVAGNPAKPLRRYVAETNEWVKVV